MTTIQSIDHTEVADFVNVRQPEIADASDMYELAYRSGLDINSQYSYLMMCEYFNSTCVIASVAKLVAGFITGFRVPESPSELFVWQIAVAPGVRGRGVGSRMLDELAERGRKDGVRYVQATISPTNEASIQTFESLADRLECGIAYESKFRPEDFSSKRHEEEILYRVGPF